MIPVIVGSGEQQRLVLQHEAGWWVVHEYVDNQWEATSGGWKRKGDAIAEARRQVAGATA